MIKKTLVVRKFERQNCRFLNVSMLLIQYVHSDTNIVNITISEYSNNYDLVLAIY